MSIDETGATDAGRPESPFFREVRRFGSHSAIYAAGTMLSRLVGLVLVPVYTHRLATAEYGVIGICALITQVTTSIAGLGLMNSLFRRWATARDEAERTTLFSTAIWTQAVLLVAVLALVAISPAWWAGILLGSPEWGLFVVFAVATGLLDMFTATPLAILRMEERPAMFVGTMATRTLVGTALAIWLVAYRDAGVGGVLLAMLLADVAVLALVLPMLVRRTRFAFDAAELKGMLPFGLWIMLTATAGMAYNLGDRYVLKHILGLGAVGVYTLGHQLATTINVLGQSFISAYLPLGLKRDVSVDGGRFVTKTLTYFVAGLVWAALPLSLLAPEIVRLLARDPSYYPALAVVPPLVLSFVLYVVTLGVGISFYFEGKSRAFLVATLVAFALNIALDFALIPSMGILGAALAAVVAAAGRFALTWRWAMRVYPLPFELRRMGIILAAAIALHGTMLVPGPVWAVVATKALAVAAFPAVLLATGVFTRTERDAVRTVVAQAFSRSRR